MFTLAAFDAHLSRQIKAQDQTLWPKLSHALRNGDSTNRLIAAIVLAGSGTFAAVAPAAVPPAPQALVVTADMSYDGMTLQDFALRMDMPADDPYLIAMFIALCATEEPDDAMTG